MNQKIHNFVQSVGKLLGIGALLLFGFTGFTGKLGTLSGWVLGGWVVLCLLWTLGKFLVETACKSNTLTFIERFSFVFLREEEAEFKRGWFRGRDAVAEWLPAIHGYMKYGGSDSDMQQFVSARSNFVNRWGDEDEGRTEKAREFMKTKEQALKADPKKREFFEKYGDLPEHEECFHYILPSFQDQGLWGFKTLESKWPSLNILPSSKSLGHLCYTLESKWPGLKIRFFYSSEMEAYQILIEHSSCISRWGQVTLYFENVTNEPWAKWLAKRYGGRLLQKKRRAAKSEARRDKSNFERLFAEGESNRMEFPADKPDGKKYVPNSG